MIDFITLKNCNNLIEGVRVHALKVNKDESGTLTEILKTSWNDVYNTEFPFAQCYYSVTAPKIVRDLDMWHLHPTKQTDRFICVRGDIVTAICDKRPGSKTYGKINLFLMGESGGDDTQFMVVIPKNTLHGFAVASTSEAVLMNFPTTLYDPAEEGRVKHSEAEVRFEDGTAFTWEKVLTEVNLK